MKSKKKVIDITLYKTSSIQIKNYKENLKLTSLQKEILYGTLLGDAHLRTENNGITFLLMIEQSLRHKPYVDHLYEIFKPWVRTLPQKRIITYKNKNHNTSCTMRFRTLAHGSFRFFGKQFYKDTKKIVPKLIHRWLTPRALAYWYMDDGSMKSVESKGVLLNTQSFSYAEVLHLCDVLTSKFNLSCWPRKQKSKTYQIYISGKSYEILRELIYDFLIPEMKYKFPLPRKKDLTKVPKK